MDIYYVLHNIFSVLQSLWRSSSWDTQKMCGLGNRIQGEGSLSGRNTFRSDLRVMATHGGPVCRLCERGGVEISLHLLYHSVALTRQRFEILLQIRQGRPRLGRSCPSLEWYDSRDIVSGTRGSKRPNMSLGTVDRHGTRVSWREFLELSIQGVVPPPLSCVSPFRPQPHNNFGTFQNREQGSTYLIPHLFSLLSDRWGEGEGDLKLVCYEIRMALC